jgi:hypothetical protein
VLRAIAAGSVDADAEAEAVDDMAVEVVAALEVVAVVDGPAARF